MRRKFQCENPVCGFTFFLDMKKNANVSKVRCPKCKHVQAIAPEPAQEEDNLDWLKPASKTPEASPNIPEIKEEPKPEKVKVEEEDFFTSRPAVQAVVKAKSTGDIGWLVVHDEYTDTSTFTLRNGLNRIGRKSDTTPRDINIAIYTKDSYMSREHCEIEVKFNGRGHQYILRDRRSTNGTFLNANPRRLSRTQEAALKDGDTIQVGRTKLVLKLPSSAGSSKAAEDWVRQSAYSPTIID